MMRFKNFLLSGFDPKESPIKRVEVKFFSQEVAMEIGEQSSRLIFRKYENDSQSITGIEINPYAALAIHSFDGPTIKKEVYKSLRPEGLFYIYRYLGDNSPLVIAETFANPAKDPEGFIDISRDPLFREYNLAVNPYSNWRHEIEDKIQ